MNLNTCLQMIYQRFYSAKSDGDMCTMFSDRTLINRRNVLSDPKNAYAANRDFLVLELKARVIAAAMNVLGFESLTAAPSKFPIPEGLQNKPRSEQIKYLNDAAGKIVDELVFTHEDSDHLIDCILTTQEKEDIVRNQQLTTDKRFPCRFEGCNKSFKYDGKSRQKHEQTHNPPPQVNQSVHPTTEIPITDDHDPIDDTKDDVYSYNCALLAHGLFFHNFLDAVKEGDGRRIMRQYKYLLLYCKADKNHSAKYALECLYQMFLVNGLLSPRDAHRYVWNRSVNNNGMVGKNIPLDLEVEHSNKFLKQAIKNLGPNVTPSAVSRICEAEKSTRMILRNLQESICHNGKSGKHTARSADKDLKVIVDKLVENHVFTKQDGRCYKSLCGFVRNPLSQLDMSLIFKWINEHKKNVKLNIKAR